MNPKEEFRLSNKMQEFLQNTRLEKGLNKVRAEHAWTEQMPITPRKYGGTMAA